MVAHAAQLSAHIIKVKLPSDRVEKAAAWKIYEQYDIPIKTLEGQAGMSCSTSSTGGGSSSFLLKSQSTSGSSTWS